MTTATTSPDQVIYLDHQATTPVDPRVLDAMLPYLTTAYGNPSSPHAYGRAADDAVRAARRQLRQLIGASADTEIIAEHGEPGHAGQRLADPAPARQPQHHHPRH